MNKGDSGIRGGGGRGGGERFFLPEITQLISGIYSFRLQILSTSSVSGLMPGSGASNAIDD